MSELPDPIILNEADLLANFAGGQPEQIAMRNFIHTLFNQITGASSSSGDGTGVTITGGNSSGGNGNGGDVHLHPGSKHGTGRNGLVFLDSLPTVDPAIAGALYNSTGTVKVSAG